MKKINYLFHLILLLAIMGLRQEGVAQIAYSSAGTNYTQNFDNLYTTVPANNTTQAASILPLGWSFVEVGANANTTLRNDNGSSGTGDTYLDGATNSNERSLGSFSSGSLTSQFGAVFTNNTGGTLTQFTLSYTGEQWKDGGSGSAILNTQTFAYSIGATSLTSGTYTNVTQLDFLAKVNNTSADVTLDGNLTANQRAISFTVTGISWPNGTTLYIRWTDINDSGNDDNLAIDGVTFSASSPCTPPAITASTSNSPICENGTLNLDVTATGSATLSYAWTGPNGFTSTSQNPSLPAATTAASGNYLVTVSNGCGSASSNVSAIVNSLPAAGITADGPTTFCIGNSVNLTSSAGTSYLWSTGETTQSINVTSSGNYTVSVTANACQATSSETVVVVNPIVTPSISIAANPGNIICSGTAVTFTANALNGGTVPSYQWKLNGNAVGTDADSYSNTGLLDQDIVTCVLTSEAICASTTSATSNAITIQVSTSVIPTISILANEGNTICNGASATFNATVTNGGASPIYDWKLNGTSVGSNSDTYSSNSLSDQDIVTCELTSSNSCAIPLTATSNSIILTVNPNLTPAVSISANTGNTICAGSNVTFTAVAVNGGTASYQWTKNGNPVGTNSATYNDVALANNDAIACSIISSETCVTAASAVSNTIIMIVNPLPQPIILGALTYCSNGSTLLDAGEGFSSYLWSNGETTQSISASLAVTYSVTVSNGLCSATSPSVTVTEMAAPAQPGAFTVSSTSVNTGQNGVVYSVPNVSGITYSWSYSGSGASIIGSSNSVTVNFNATATSGTLSVTATNSCGISTARTMAITVVQRPDMRITEYMYNGGGAGGLGEFVEFTNIGSSAIDMSGWSYDDNSRLAGSQSLTAFGIVQPGESVILTELNAGVFRANWNLCAGVKIIGGNANNLGREDEINLYDASNNLIDRLTYGDQTFSPGSIRTTLKSGWVNALGIGNNAITQWTLSAAADAEVSFASTLAEIGSPGKSTRATVSFDPCFVANGAPTIALNVINTTNYIDAGVNTSPNSPFGLSGVINDATDPASVYGLDFTIGDDVTPVANLTVSVQSSNTTVVPTANLILSGTGANRNVKITPTSIGYSTLTISVNDGILTSVYVLNYAASDPSPNLIPANTYFHSGMSDGSDAIALDDNFYISGDDELDILNVYSRANSGLPFVSYDYSSHLSLPDPSKPEVDVEAGTRSTSNNNKIYWTGSMSNGKLPYDNKPNRDRLFATTVTGTGAAASFAFSGYVNIRTALLAWGDANGYNFTASAAAGVDPKGISGFSLEGMTFGPDGTTLYLGLRAPLVPTSLRHNAVIAPIQNFEAWFNNGAPTGHPTFGTPIELDMDYRGIRDITRLSNGTYIIIAGSPIEDGGINNIYKWSGYATDAPILIPNAAGGILNIEGVMQVNDQNGLSLSQLQIVTDGGAANLYGDNNQAKDLGDLNLRKFRSDVLIGLDLDICTGFTASITPGGTTNICPGNTVALSASSGSNYSYQWSNGATTQTINAGAFVSYTVEITSTTSGCTAISAAVPVTNALPSDFNSDHVVDNIDFLQILGLFNQPCSSCLQDINKDGVVDNIDFLVILGQFNQSCN